MSTDYNGSVPYPPIVLPDGSVFASAVTAVSYIDAEGNGAYLISRSGASSFLQSLGLLEAAKYALIQENEERE